MTLLIKSGDAAAFVEWHDCFARLAPGLKVRNWPDPEIDPEEVRYVLVWEPDPGRLASFPNLRVIFSSAAGVDHILRDPQLPAHLPLVRMATSETAQRMGEYVCWSALSLMRRAPELIAAKAARRWDNNLSGETALATRAGVMGLGQLGTRAAQMLAGLGFITAGWSSRPKQIPGVESFVGDDAFPAFLARTDILVCLLPLTEATRGIIRAETLALLPQGASIINVGRGGHVVLPELIAALDNGHIKGAALDVFDVEPLPQDSPVWSHPGILVTPHIASSASRRSRSAHVAANIAAFERDEAMTALYDPARGY